MQTKRLPTRRSMWELGWRYLLLALPVGLGLLLGCLLLFAVMMMVADAPEWLLSLAAALSLCVSSYGMGRFAGFHRRRSGLQTGLVCGLALYLLLLLAGIFWQNLSGGWIRPACLLLGGACGGISGTNAVHHKPPR